MRFPAYRPDLPSRCVFRAFTLLELLLAVVIIAVLLVIGLGSLQHMREAARSAGCVANLRAIYLMMNQYAADHRNCYPIGYSRPHTWTGQTAAYRPPHRNVKEGITYCPSTSLNGEGIYQRDRSTWRTDYNINRFVASNIESDNHRSVIPGHLIFLFDGNGAVVGSASNAKEAARHRGRFNLLFTDGHVETGTAITAYENHWKR